MQPMGSRRRRSSDRHVLEHVRIGARVAPQCELRVQIFEDVRPRTTRD